MTSSKRLFDIGQETSYRRIADEQTLLKIRFPDVKITSNRLVLSGKLPKKPECQISII